MGTVGDQMCPLYGVSDGLLVISHLALFKEEFPTDSVMLFFPSWGLEDSVRLQTIPPGEEAG